MTVGFEKIKINEEYASLVPPYSPSEYQPFKEDIRQNRVQIPIIVNENGGILDGHHRYRVWVIDLGRPVEEMPKPIVMHFEDKLQEKLFVINVNLKRRHLNDFQKVELALKAKPILEEIAKRNESLGGKGVEIKTPLGRVDQEIGKRAGVGKDTVRKVEEILEKGTPGEIQKLRAGTSKINKIHNQIQFEGRRKKLLEDAAKSSSAAVPNGVELILGDCIEKSKGIPDHSVDLIFTDPPYSKEYIYLYKELAKVATRISKPGANIITYAGQVYLPTVFNLLLDREYSDLSYWCEMVVKHNGGSAKLHYYKLRQTWKPLLCFVNDTTYDPLDHTEDSIEVDNWIESTPPDKSLHEWAQSTTEAEYIISKFTVENQVVLDPFMGSGTTGVAALKLNRKFIGIEIDREKFEIARANIYNSRSITPRVTA